MTDAKKPPERGALLDAIAELLKQAGLNRAPDLLDVIAGGEPDTEEGRAEFKAAIEKVGRDKLRLIETIQAAQIEPSAMTAIAMITCGLSLARMHGRVLQVLLTALKYGQSTGSLPSKEQLATLLATKPNLIPMVAELFLGDTVKILTGTTKDVLEQVARERSGNARAEEIGNAEGIRLFPWLRR